MRKELFAVIRNKRDVTETGVVDIRRQVEHVLCRSLGGVLDGGGRGEALDGEMAQGRVIIVILHQWVCSQPDEAGHSTQVLTLSSTV